MAQEGDMGDGFSEQVVPFGSKSAGESSVDSEFHGMEIIT